MSEIIIKQSDRLYCLFSLSEQKIIKSDLELDDIVRYFVEQTVDKIKPQIEELVKSRVRVVEEEGTEISYDRALELTERNTLSRPSRDIVKRSISTKHINKIVTHDGVEHILEESEDSNYPDDLIDELFEEMAGPTTFEGLMEKVNRFFKRKNDERNSG